MSQLIFAMVHEQPNFYSRLMFVSNARLTKMCSILEEISSGEIDFELVDDEIGKPELLNIAASLRHNTSLEVLR